VVTIKLTSGAKARTKIFDFDFADLEIKGRGAGGNILTKYPVRKIELKSAGVSTLSGLNVWYDKSVGRLNTDQRGEHIGNFNGEDRVLVIYQDGNYELTTYDLTNHYEPAKINYIRKLSSKDIISAVHYDGSNKNYYIKRFVVETNTIGKKYCFISEEKGSKMTVVSVHPAPLLEVDVLKGKAKEKDTETIEINDFIDVKGWKAIGNKLSQHTVKKVKLIETEIEQKEVKPEPIAVVAPKTEPIETPKVEKTQKPEVIKKTVEKTAPKLETEKPASTTEESVDPDKTKSDEPPKKDDGKNYSAGETIELF
jgi:topoisomerase-4 subunit A